jgi:molybdenum ABC transporter molybdate-binding protein
MADGNGCFKAQILAVAILVSTYPNMIHAQSASPAQPPLVVAAGSLRQAMDDILRAYQEKGGQRFEVRYGPSGNLRKEIETGLKVDAFASASVDHTEALAAAKLLGPSKEFTHNDLCIVSRTRLAADTSGLLQSLSDPALRLATSTPVADPMGDYTWQFFRNAERRQPGIYQLLDTKALKLSGSAAPAAGNKPPYVTAFEQNQADAYVMYCTNAVATAKAVPGLHTVRIPDELNVPGAYGIAAHPSSAEGEGLVRFILSRDGQAILEQYEFH